MLISKPFVVSLLAVGALFAVYFVLFSPQYESIDDVQMAMTASGTAIATAPEERIHFSNVLIGRFLKQLYVHQPGIAWYGMYLLAVHVALHVTMLYAMLLAGFGWQRLWLYCMFFFTLGIYFLNHLQFTSTAILAGISGVFLIVATAERFQWQFTPATPELSEPSHAMPVEHTKEIHSKFGIAEGRATNGARCILGILLIVVASLIRSYGLLFSLLLTGPFVLRVLLWRGSRVSRVLVASSLAAGIMLALAAYLYDASPAGRGADWWAKERTRRLALRFVDYDSVPYNEQTKPLFDDVGWSQNDFEMLMQYGYLDQRRYSDEKMQAVLNRSPRRTEFDARRWAIGLLGTLYTAALAPQLLFGALVVVSVLIANRMQPAGRFVLIASAALSIAVLFALLEYQHRVPPWVFFPAASYPLLLAIYQHRPTQQFPGTQSNRSAWRIRLGVPIIAGLGAVWPFYDNWQTCTRLQARTGEFREDIRELKPGPDQLFVLSINNDWTCPVLEVPAEFETLRLFYIGPPQLTPAGQRVLREFQVADLFRALYEQSNVFLIGTPRFNHVYRQYIKEHYGVDVAFRVRFQGRRFTAYDVFAKNGHRSPAGEVSTR